MSHPRYAGSTLSQANVLSSGLSYRRDGGLLVRTKVRRSALIHADLDQPRGRNEFLYTRCAPPEWGWSPLAKSVNYEL